MASRLTEAQRLNLVHVRDRGQPIPRSKAAYNCRVADLTEFLWLYEDGVTAATSEKVPGEGCWLVKVIGERLTPEGRAALEKRDE